MFDKFLVTWKLTHHFRDSISNFGQMTNQLFIRHGMKHHVIMLGHHTLPKHAV